MNRPPLHGRPALKPGCRLSAASTPEPLLLIPEGALRMEGPALRIVQLCDGQRTLSDLIDSLCQEFESAEPARVGDDVTEFLERLREKGAVEFL